MGGSPAERMRSADDDLDQWCQSVAADLRTTSDRRVIGEHLDSLASVAARHEPSLHLILEQIVERQLAEVSIRAYLLDPSLVDDAVQETIVSVATGIGSFRGKSGFLTWLDRVARNEARNLIRKRQRLSEPASNELPEQHGWQQRLSSIVVRQRTIDQAMSELEESYREVIVLREQHELSYEQIAEKLDLPLNTVRTRLRRGRQQLACLLLAPSEAGR